MRHGPGLLGQLANPKTKRECSMSQYHDPTTSGLGRDVTVTSPTPCGRFTFMAVRSAAISLVVPLSS